MGKLKFFLVATLLISACSSGQARESIVVMLHEYSQNIGKPGFDHNFVDDRLNPALQELEKIVCRDQDQQLFERFLDMMRATSGSANETPADVLAGIFVCRPDMVEFALKGKYNDDYLLEMLDSGFLNITSAEKPANYPELQLRLASLLK